MKKPHSKVAYFSFCFAVLVLPKSARSAQTGENSHIFFNVSYTWYKSLNDIRLECESWNLNLKLYLRAGASSHDCILRSLCEVARTPQNQDGLFGDFINLLLAPSYILDQPSESFKDSDYLEAQRTGKFIYPKCYKKYAYALAHKTHFVNFSLFWPK